MFTRRLSVKNVQKIIIIAINSSNVFLMTPYRLDENGNFELSKPRYILAWALTAAAIAGVIGRSFIASNIDQLKHNPYLFLSFARVLYYDFYAILSALHLHSRHRKVIEILNEIKKIDKILIFDQKKLKILYWGLNLQLLAFFCSVTFFTALLVILQETSGYMAVLLNLCWMYVSILLIFNELFFFDLNYLFGLYIELIHKELADLADRKGIEIRPQVVPKISTTIKIRQLRKTFGDINDLKTQLNDVNSVRLLYSITAAFIECVYHAFLYITMVQYQHLPFSMLRNFSIQIWAFSVILEIGFAIYICDLLTKKTMKTGVYVHRLMANTKDVDSKEELIMFSMELTHRNPYITAAGFFNVDFTLMYSMMGAIAMYIIILIQFKFPKPNAELSPVESLTYYL